MVMLPGGIERAVLGDEDEALLITCWVKSKTTGNFRFVLVTLALLADIDGITTVDNLTVSNMTGLAPSTVRNALRGLERQGEIETVAFGGGRGIVNSYQILIIPEIPAETGTFTPGCPV